MIQRHPIYWFDDGDTVLHQELITGEYINDVLYRIHLSKLSSVLPSRQAALDLSDDELKNLKAKVKDDLELDLLDSINGCKYIVLDRERAVDANDLAILLDHSYGQNVLSRKSELNRIIAILRITSANQLDIPTLHEEAKEYFADLVPNDAQKLARFQCHCPEDAMVLAVQHKILPPQKPLLYYLATQTDSSSLSDDPTSMLCHTLSANLISLFTPLLFTPPPTSHMECTDALAEHWMPLVIAPAIEDSAMGKPLQTLERMKSLNWTSYGICDDCVRDKREEWTEEQSRVWELMDEWISDSVRE